MLLFTAVGIRPRYSLGWEWDGPTALCGGGEDVIKELRLVCQRDYSMHTCHALQIPFERGCSEKVEPQPAFCFVLLLSTGEHVV